MLIVLPIAVFALLAHLLMQRGDTGRQAILRSATLTTAILVGITELLSISSLLTRTGLILSWSVVLVWLIALSMNAKQKASETVGASPRSVPQAPSTFTLLEIALASGIAFSFGCVGLVALIAPPNSWDSMEHHLPRVIFWVSNHSVGVYPTPDFAQLLKGPGAEFIALHTYLLTGSDRLVNLIEFFSFTGCGIGASLIAKKLGSGRIGQLLAMLFVVTIPAAVLESSGAMTTTVASFWAITACYFILQAGSIAGELDVVTAALATGLALLTDPVSFHALPMVLLACILFRPSESRIWLLKRLPVFLVLALAVNAGQFVRAYELTGNIFGSPFPEGGPRLNFSDDRLTAPAIAANVLRQASLQMGTPSDKLNDHTEAIVRRAIRLIGEDPDNPGASWSGFPFYIDHPTRLETQAGNPVHFFLIIGCIGIAVFSGSKDKNKRLLWFCGGLLTGFIVFCAVVRWQPWGSRFELPLFVLSAAVFGVIAERSLKRRWMIAAFALFLLLIAAPYLLSNSTRSILATKGFPTIFQPRANLYFGDQHEALAPAYLAMAQAIRDRRCGRVAIDDYLPIPEPQIKMSPPAYYIYPLLAQLDIDGQERIVHYIGVSNSTKRFKSSNDERASYKRPDCAVICLTCRLSNGVKSDARLGETQIFGESELVFSGKSAEEGTGNLLK